MIHYIKTKSSITVVSDGVPFSLTTDAPQYERLVQAVLDQDEDAIRTIANAADDVRERLSKFGDVEVFGGYVKFRGEEIHNYLVEVILHNEDPEPVAHFLNNVMANPSRRAVEDLYKWCEKAQMPLTRDGCIIAYKLVRNDFKDIYSGTFDNSPGKTVEVPRNRVDEDPDRTCNHGLHFCSAGYLPHYGGGNSRIVLVKVNPADVVAFPTDHNLAKARCCKYEVIEEIAREKLLPAGFGYYETAPELDPDDELDAFESEDLVYIRDLRDNDYVINVGFYDEERPEPMTRANAEGVIAKYDENLRHNFVIVPEDEDDDFDAANYTKVFIRDADGDYIEPTADLVYRYTPDKPEPMSRAEAEALIARTQVTRWTIVPEGQNDAWTPGN